jgi:hypothetical protein
MSSLDLAGDCYGGLIRSKTALAAAETADTTASPPVLDEPLRSTGGTAVYGHLLTELN